MNVYGELTATFTPLQIPLMLIGKLPLPEFTRGLKVFHCIYGLEHLLRKKKCNLLKIEKIAIGITGIKRDSIPIYFPKRIPLVNDLPETPFDIFKRKRI